MGSPQYTPAWQAPQLTEDYVSQLKAQNKPISYQNFGITDFQPLLTEAQRNDFQSKINNFKNSPAGKQGYQINSTGGGDDISGWTLALQKDEQNRKVNEILQSRRDVIDQQYQTISDTLANKAIAAQSAANPVNRVRLSQLAAGQSANRSSALTPRGGVGTTILTSPPELGTQVGGKTLLGM